MSKCTELLIIGDSISLGVAELRINDIVGSVHPSYTELIADGLPGVRIHVDADIHRTTVNALPILEQLLLTHKPDAVLIMLGGNDADVEWRRFVISGGRIGRSRVKVETYEHNLETLAGKVKAAGAIPVLTDMPNHYLAVRGPYLSHLSGKDVTAMIAANGGQERSDVGLQHFRLAAARVAERMACPLVDYGQALHMQPPEQMCGPDGVHPSRQAHEIIARQLEPVLRRILLQEEIPFRRMPA